MTMSAGRVPEKADISPAMPLRAGTAEGVRPAAHFSFANPLPIRTGGSDMIALSIDHYLEIAQARVDQFRAIDQMRTYIRLQEQGIERLERENQGQADTITRLQNDRRDLLSTLREIHEAAPAENPGDLHDGMSLDDAEALGLDKGYWEAGEVARQGIEKVGASLHVDIPRRRVG